MIASNNQTHARQIFSVCLGSMLACSMASAQAIAHDIRTNQLTARASYEQQDLPQAYCVRGNWRATATINGLVSGGLISCPEYDGWAIGGTGQEQYSQSILWTFQGGARWVDAIQLLQNYSVNSYPLHLTDFDLWFTTDANPTLQSSFQPLQLTRLSGVAGFVSDSFVKAYPGGWVAGGKDYRVEWSAVHATAIRLHVHPNSSFTLTEVSMRSAPASGSFFRSFAPGCLGSNGVPTLAGANGQVPGAGRTFTMVLTNLPMPQALAILLVGSGLRFLQMRDVPIVQDLVREAEEELWPAHPDRVAAMDRWLVRARHVQARLAGHRAALAELRSKALPISDALQREEQELAKLRGERDEKRVLLDKAKATDRESARRKIPELTQDLADLVEKLKPRELAFEEQRWQFATFEDRFLHQTLVEIVRQIERLVDRGRGAMASVELRKRRPETLAERSVGDEKGSEKARRLAAAWPRRRTTRGEPTTTRRPSTTSRRFTTWL